MQKYIHYAYLYFPTSLTKKYFAELILIIENIKITNYGSFFYSFLFHVSLSINSLQIINRLVNRCKIIIVLIYFDIVTIPYVDGFLTRKVIWRPQSYFGSRPSQLHCFACFHGFCVTNIQKFQLHTENKIRYLFTKINVPSRCVKQQNVYRLELTTLLPLVGKCY